MLSLRVPVRLGLQPSSTSTDHKRFASRVYPHGLCAPRRRRGKPRPNRTRTDDTRKHEAGCHTLTRLGLSHIFEQCEYTPSKLPGTPRRREARRILTPKRARTTLTRSSACGWRFTVMFANTHTQTCAQASTRAHRLIMHLIPTKCCCSKQCGFRTPYQPPPRTYR